MPLAFPPLLVLAAFVGSCLLTSGCVAPNPKHTSPASTAPAYIVDPRLAAASNTVAQLAQVAATSTGTGPLIPTAANGILAAIGAVSLLIARHHSQTSKALARGVAAAGQTVRANVLAALDGDPKHGAASALVHDAKRAQPPSSAAPPTNAT